MPTLTEGVPGYRGVNMLALECDGVEVEVTVLIWFDSMDAVREYAGGEVNRAIAPPEQVEGLLLRYDGFVQHHTVLI